jgi:hypothetical protein
MLPATVLYAMVHLPQQQILILRRPFPIRNITRDLGCAYGFAVAVADRRDRQSDVDEGAVLATADRLDKA